mmetsp:Transcript_27708/g.69155  ORF Transcript_27708/g.69155 Transcript_27708/m.69155 type:complete len:202 (-) Transcript_27708:81-686(-)
MQEGIAVSRGVGLLALILGPDELAHVGDRHDALDPLTDHVLSRVRRHVHQVQLHVAPVDPAAVWLPPPLLASVAIGSATPCIAPLHHHVVAVHGPATAVGGRTASAARRGVARCWRGGAALLELHLHLGAMQLVALHVPHRPLRLVRLGEVDKSIKATLILTNLDSHDLPTGGEEVIELLLGGLPSDGCDVDVTLSRVSHA